jgi:peptidoglycan-associated lipoprotein
MSKKILLLSSVIFLSSCGANNISELGDKFLDLINPSDAATEQADLGGDEILIAIDEDGGFTISELEQLSNDDLIAIAKEKGLGDLIVLDADGNLQNRDQIINAIVESGDLLDGKTAELELLSDDALIEMAIAKGIDFELDADGNLVNRDALIKALMDDAAALLAIIENFKNSSDSFILYFSYDDTEIDEVSTRAIIEHANFMQDNPSVSLRLEGHADERGTREYNLALGENRALSVKEVLNLYNLDDRIIVVSYGEESPVLYGSSEEAWKKNRRVEFSYY